MRFWPVLKQLLYLTDSRVVLEVHTCVDTSKSLRVAWLLVYPKLADNFAKIHIRTRLPPACQTGVSLLFSPSKTTQQCEIATLESRFLQTTTMRHRASSAYTVPRTLRRRSASCCPRIGRRPSQRIQRVSLSGLTPGGDKKTRESLVTAASSSRHQLSTTST